MPQLPTYYMQNYPSSATAPLIGTTARLHTGQSVTEICYDCGFGSYSHFMRTFREHYGMSPIGFRTLHRKK